MSENEISFLIRKAIFKVYNTLGPGLFESVCVAALSLDLQRMDLRVRTQVTLPVIYDSVRIEMGFKIDMIVEEKVIVEVKSVETILDVHHKQVITYLKLSGLKLGLLVNFNTPDISKSIYRKVNGL